MTELHDLNGAVRVDAPRFACVCPNCRRILTAGTLECPICGAATMCDDPRHFPGGENVKVELSKYGRPKGDGPVEAKP
jgi:hypothetical protein